MTDMMDAAAPPRASTARILGRGWRVFVPVVLVNAAVQALTTVPFLTPAADVWFLLLALGSAVALVVSAVLVFAAARAASDGTHLRLTWRLVVAASLTVLVVGAVAVLPATPVVLLLAFVVLPGVARGDAFAGFRAFGAAPAGATAGAATIMGA